ncbi:hypothetical protein MASR2M79_06510 [Aminivibrio sp.]
MPVCRNFRCGDEDGPREADKSAGPPQEGKPFSEGRRGDKGCEDRGRGYEHARGSGGDGHFADVYGDMIQYDP